MRFACPVCQHCADPQPLYHRGDRIYQSFICDTADCAVSSYRIEWKTPL